MQTATRTLTQYEGLPGRVVFGAGSIAELPAEVDRLQCGKVLLVDGLLDGPVVARVTQDLGGRHVETISVARQHVPAELAQAALQTANSVGADCLLSIGGGSALGVAKSVARQTRLPIVALPTTYAGSEMTPIWGVTADGQKTTGRDLAVLPRTVVYDPELTVSLPAAATAASGMNAIAHCVEAMWTRDRNPVTDAIASEAIAQLAAGLRGSVTDPQDIDARGQALRGAWLAGMALAQAGTGLHHKICHVLGGTFDLPHADVHAAVLPWVVEGYRSVAPDALRRTAAALRATDAVAGLQQLATDLHVEAGLAELGLDADGAARAADLVAAGSPAEPAPVTRDQIHAILEQAMTAGRPRDPSQGEH